MQRAAPDYPPAAAAGATGRAGFDIDHRDAGAPVGPGAASLPDRRRPAAQVEALDCAARRIATPEATAPALEPTRPADVRAPPKVDLSFSALPNLAQQRVASATPGEDLERFLAPPPLPAGRPRDVDQLRADFDRRVAAVENVRAGRAHPLHFDYLRGARDRLTAEATRLAEQLPLGPAESAKGWLRGYLGRVAEVNRGTARDLPESPRDDPFGPRPDVLGQYREMGRQAASGAVERTAEVCLGVAPDHAVVVTLRRSSGNAALDRLAIEAFRASADARPVAPRDPARARLLPRADPCLPGAADTQHQPDLEQRPQGDLSTQAHDRGLGRAGERRLRRPSAGRAVAVDCRAMSRRQRVDQAGVSSLRQAARAALVSPAAVQQPPSGAEVRRRAGAPTISRTTPRSRR